MRAKKVHSRDIPRESFTRPLSKPFFALLRSALFISASAVFASSACHASAREHCALFGSAPERASARRHPKALG